MTQLLQDFLPILLFIATGIVLRRVGILSGTDGRGLSRLVLYLTLPAISFVALYKAELDASLLLLSFLGVAIPMILIGVAYVIGGWLRLEPAEKGVFICTASVTNLGFFLFPIFQQLYGFEGLARLAIYDAGNAIIAYLVSYGIARHYGGRMREGEGFAMNWRAIATSPGLWAVALGLGFNSAGVVIPAPIMDALETAASANVLLVMLALGYYLTPQMENTRLVVLGILIKMGGGLLLGLAAATIFQLDGLSRIVVIMAPAMPTGMTTLIYAVNEGLNTRLAAVMVSAMIIVGFGLVMLLSAAVTV